MIRCYSHFITVILIVIDGLSHQWSLANRNVTRELYLGGLFPLNDPEWVGTKRILQAAQLAVRHVNENPNILPDYSLNFIWNSTQVRTVLLLILLQNTERLTYLIHQR